MQLHVSPTSPFARNVRIAIIELGLTGRVPQVVIDPWTDEAYRAVNPLARVPALTLHDGTILTESTTIAAYLDELAGGSLFADRWSTLRLAGLANGRIEATVKLVIERRRPAVPGYGAITLAVALAYGRRPPSKPRGRTRDSARPGLCPGPAGGRRPQTRIQVAGSKGDALGGVRGRSP